MGDKLFDEIFLRLLIGNEVFEFEIVFVCELDPAVAVENIGQILLFVIGADHVQSVQFYLHRFLLKFVLRKGFQQRLGLPLSNARRLLHKIWFNFKI